MNKNSIVKANMLKALEISLLLFITIWFIPNSIFAQGDYEYPYNYGLTQSYNFGAYWPPNFLTYPPLNYRYYTPPPYLIQNSPYNYVGGGHYYYPDDAAYLLLNYGYDVYNPSYWNQPLGSGYLGWGSYRYF